MSDDDDLDKLVRQALMIEAEEARQAGAVGRPHQSAFSAAGLLMKYCLCAGSVPRLDASMPRCRDI